MESGFPAMMRRKVARPCFAKAMGGQGAPTELTYHRAYVTVSFIPHTQRSFHPRRQNCRARDSKAEASVQVSGEEVLE